MAPGKVFQTPGAPVVSTVQAFNDLAGRAPAAWASAYYWQMRPMSEVRRRRQQRGTLAGILLQQPPWLDPTHQPQIPT